MARPQMGETKLALQVKVEWLESKLAQAEARVLELGTEAAAMRDALEWILECQDHFYSDDGRIHESLYPYAGVFRSLFGTAHRALAALDGDSDG